MNDKEKEEKLREIVNGIEKLKNEGELKVYLNNDAILKRIPKEKDDGSHGIEVEVHASLIELLYLQNVIEDTLNQLIKEIESNK